MSSLPRYRFARRLSWLVVAALTSVALFAPGAIVQAAHVTPIPISSGNPTCADFAVSHGGGQAWLETKSDPPGNGTITVAGFGTITITNFTQSTSETAGSFDWSSTFGIDAVFVKAGSDKHNLYVYAPTAASVESTGDTGLSPQAGTGNGISHISFCYDTDSAPPSSAPPSSAPPSSAPPSSAPPSSAPPSSAPPSSAPPSSAPPSGSVLPTESTAPTSTPTGEVGGATATPGTTLPPTDTLGGTGAAPGSDTWRLVLLALAGTLAGALLLTPARAVRKDR